MNCKSTVGMLSAYLDRELALEERDAVRAHLADCDRCRVEERDLRALKGLLLGVRAPEPAADFEERLMSRLHAEASTPVRPRLAFPKFRPLVIGQLGGLAAAAALATIVVVHGPQAKAPSSSVRPVETVAQNDYTVDQERDMAWSQGDDYTTGSPILMPR